MSVNIDALFQHLMEDPDIIPPEGEDKEDIAMAMARQRAKQSNNNTKALSMASADRSVSKLLYFLKADDDDAESASGTEELKPEIDTAEFGMHERNFRKHQGKVSNARKQGKEPEWETIKTGDRKGQLSAKGSKEKDEWEAAYEYLGDIEDYTQVDRFDNEIAEALEEQETGEAQEAEDVSEDGDGVPEAAPETPAPKGRESFAAGQAGESPSDVAERNRIRALPEGERQIAREAFIQRKLAEADAQADATKPHHSLTSAVDALSDAAPDVELDNYGNDPDSPFHADRFGHTPAGARAFDNIHEKYRKEDLAQAYNQIESQGKQRAINFDGKDGGSLVESAIHRMMDDFFESTGKQEAPSHVVPGQQPSEDADKWEISTAEDTPASNWFEANVPDKGAAATAWDKYVSDNFGNDLSKVDEHKINEHLHNFLKGRGKKNLTTPPKPTPTAEHVAPEVQKEIVIASQDEDDPKKEIEAKLAENVRSVIDNPDLSPHQKNKRINAANAIGKAAAKKVSTPEKEITIEPPDDVATSQAILEHAADIHIEAEANGETDEEKAKAAENLHDAVISHETAGGDAEPVLKEKGTRYKKLDSGQYHFQGGAKVWGDLSQRDAIGQAPEGEEPSTDTPEAQDERQGEFDFDAPAPEPPAIPEAAETPPETGTDDVTEKHMQAWLDNHVGQKEDPDYEPRRNQIEAGLRRQLEDEPGLLEEGKGWGEIRQRAEANNFMPELEEVKPTEEAPEETPTTEPKKKKLTPKQESSIRAAKTVQDAAQKSLAEEQANQEKHKKAEEEAKAKFDELQATPNMEDLPQAELDKIGADMDKAKNDGRAARKSQQTSQGHMNRHQKKIDDTNAAIERATPSDEGAEQGQLIPDEEVKPTEETSEETTTAEPEPESTEGEVEPEVAVAPPDAEAGEAVAEPVGEPAPKPARKPRQRKPTVTPEAPAEAEVAVTPADTEAADGVSEDPLVTPEETPKAKAARVKKEKDFLLANKMTPEHLASLTDEEVNKEFKNAHKKISDKAMADNLKGIPDKEEVIQDMADAVDRGTDEEYKETLRKENKYTSVQDLIKQHKENQQRRADSAFEHASNDANSSALKMDVLPEEGTDKLHALDRARDIAKKMDTSNRAVKNGGKPLLDRNSMSHLKDLLDDAMDKGDLQQDEIDGIADEADRMGEDYLNDDHKASIDAANDKQRAHHEDFLAHAEGMSEEALQRKGHDLDHSKGHELHDYETNEDGTIGKRTGSSYHSRNEDGSVEHLDGSGRAESVDDAVEGMEAQHPPKLLGLDKQGQIEQGEHFELMKKAAAGKLEEGDFDKFKALEAKTPALADPKYKGQVLGAARHQLSAEDGSEKMNAMGIDEKDHDEAAGSSCRPPPGAMPPGGDKGWNPDTHRWCDKEYLESVKGELGPGEASYHPEGLHAGTEHAHLDQDADGNVQGVMVTPTGVHKVNPPTGGSKGMKSADGGAVNHADVLGHHLADHPGGKVDKKTLNMMGMNHSEKHTGKGQGALGRAFKETPGMQAVGKLGRMLSRNKEREAEKPNATGQDRQRARRGTDGSPIKSVLSRIGQHTKEGLKDAAEELPTYAGGGMARDTDRYRDKQTRKAVKKVQAQERSTQKLTDSVNRVLGENG